MRILYGSDSPTNNTGFALVSRYLTHNFSKLGHEQIVVGWQEPGMERLTCAKCQQDITMYGKVIDPCRLYRLVPDAPAELGLNGKVSFSHYLRKYEPDIFMSLADLNWLVYVPSMKGNVPWLAYFPIDSHNWSEEYNSLLEKCEYPVTYSKHAQKLCYKNGFKKVRMIYHGTDPSIFKQYPKKNLQETLDFNFYSHGLPKDLFLVGTIQTVNPRKNWDAWLHIFAEFAKDKPNVMACLITDPNSPFAYHSQINLRRIVKILDIERKVWSPSNYYWWAGFSDKEMAEVTNWFRTGCYFSAASGEGFGLPLFQAMHCGVPVVAMDYTTPSEFLEGGRGYLFKASETVDNIDGMDRPLPDIEDAVEKLNRCYYNAEEREKIATRGMAWAKTITWNTVTYEWQELFKEIEESKSIKANGNKISNRKAKK